MALLSPEEAISVQRFKFQEDQKRAMLSRCNVQKPLPANLAINDKARGRPKFTCLKHFYACGAGSCSEHASTNCSEWNGMQSA